MPTITGTPRIADTQPRRWADVHATIIDTDTVNIGSARSYRCVLDDRTGQLDLLFLGQPTVRGLNVGVGCRVLGRVAMRAGRRVVWNPRYQLDPPPIHPGRSTSERKLRPHRDTASE